ncbi:MAG: hypothetical protein WBA18_05310, partial [Terracidiphilus sp.]
CNAAHPNRIETPVRRAMIAYCRQCGSADVRPSHLQPGDWGYFLRLRYPVRCRSCRHRGSVSLLFILSVWYHHRKRTMRSGTGHGWQPGKDRFGPRRFK